ncbi:lysylphosphatidylglycerol synthase domain-containing protein [Psychroserpens damuponensis]|uniref:lysylphosphatidylglycerol synthase domain-containing protein n=1 Tax=Psychroserpens damuponensis TaxID=943936 RepID=UPI00059080A2|nr:lysylphosphatidylglycerol synthase domain-containing protein [Psychroserpens damuponensis]
MNFGGLPYKTKQFFFVLIKLSIVVGAFYFIYHKLTHNDDLDFHDFIHFLNKNDVFSFKNISILLFLSIFNWFFEILKWKNLVSFLTTISFKTALEQSLGALTASLFTPNRIGEYGAKAMYFKTDLRKKVMLLNLIGNMMQMTITVIFGCIGLYVMHSTYNLDINYFKMSRVLFIVVVIIGFAFLGFRQNTFKIKGLSIEKLKSFFRDLPFKIQLTAFGLSMLRYLMFSFQFYMLLIIFGVDILYLQAMMVITSMYILSSIIPSIFIFDVIIKGSVAVYLFSIIDVNELTILSIIMVMWLLNFVLPSIFGSYYVLNFNLPKTDNTL